VTLFHAFHGAMAWGSKSTKRREVAAGQKESTAVRAWSSPLSRELLPRQCGREIEDMVAVSETVVKVLTPTQQRSSWGLSHRGCQVMGVKS